MAKKHTRMLQALAITIAFALQAQAQLPSGTIAPNFTATDLEGQNWHLYEMLDQGKIVFLEFSATWCPPCWAYHNGHAMHNLYNQHGPDGDDKARVLFIEGDPSTNEQCLYGTVGCNNYTPGNWTTGTPFPIIDNAELADTFEVSYYPTIFVVCPNRKAYEVGQWNAADLWEQAKNCPVASGNNNAGIFNYSTGSVLDEVCGTLDLTPAFTLINLGTEALTQATVALKWDNTTIQTIEWQGNQGLYGEVPIVFDTYPINTAGKLETAVISVNNSPLDDDPANNTQTNEFETTEEFNSLQVLLKIRTDQYGAETYWELRDKQGGVLEYGGNQAVGPTGGGLFTGINSGPGAYDNNVFIRDTLNLPGPGCYSIHFVDAYGDGLCCNYGNGYYKLYNLDNPTQPILHGGAFRAYEDRAFSADMISPTSKTQGIEPGIQLYPNPASDLVTLELDLPEKTRVASTILNTLGQVVFQQTPKAFLAGWHQITLPIGDLPKGLYWLRLGIGTQQHTRKLVISR